MAAKLVLQVQYFTGCPHAEQALELVGQYIQKHKNTAAEYINVRDDRQAREIGFRGSPTILINGQDMTGVPAPAEPNLACRFYPEGLPSLREFEEIVRKLTKL